MHGYTVVRRGTRDNGDDSTERVKLVCRCVGNVTGGECFEQFMRSLEADVRHVRCVTGGKDGWCMSMLYDCQVIYRVG